MRKVLVTALLLGLWPGFAAAQGAGSCRECAQDSAQGLRRQRMGQRELGDRLARLARELGSVQRKLQVERELSDGERRRLKARARRLESDLAKLGARFSIEVTDQAIKDVQPAIAEVERTMAAAMAHAGVAASRAAHEAVRFAGWIGITLDAPSAVEARGGDVYWRFFDHPEIVSVDPSSPAERSGIRQGDVLLAYDGQDVRRAIAMNRLLQPGRTVRVRVRVRGDREVRDVPVRVAPARELVWREWEPGVPVAPHAVKRRTPRPSGETWARTPAAPGVPGIDGAHTGPGPVASFLRVGNGLAGARMETITPGLGEAVGAERGVLVLSVAPGLPAHESGLLDGDVILKADGHDVSSVRELSTLVARAEHRAVKLDVARKGKTRQVTLRW